MAYNQLYNNNYGNVLKTTTNILPKVYGTSKKRESYYDVPTDRTLLDRTFDVLNVGQYAAMGLIRGFVDDELNPIEGMVKGLAAANPFGDGNEEWEYNFSDILEEIGWQPETTGGKIARGVVGFVGDVLLDPLTYVSGGVGGLIKGTGKHSAKAALGLADDVADISKGVKMTQEVAEEVVKKSKVFKSGKVGSDVAQEATELMNKYNKLIGINNKTSDVVFSLANAPFGKKIFGKHADKSYKLIDSDVMKALGDKTLAPIYGKIRNKIYGGQIGKLFSTTHPLYKMAQSNPDQVYNFMKQMDLSVGNAKGRRTMAEVVKQKADLLGDLTPAQQKEIVDALEDKTIWGKVKKTINFIDTKEAARYTKQIEKSRDAASKKIDDVTNLYNKYKGDLAKTNLSVQEQEKVLDILKNEYIADLITLNENHVVELGRTNEVIDELLRANNIVHDFSIDNIKQTGFTVTEQIDQIIKGIENPNGVNRNKLVDTFYELMPGLKTRSDDISAAKDLIDETTGVFEVGHKTLNKLDKPISFEKDVDAFKDFVSKIDKPENLSEHYMKIIRENGFYSGKRSDYIKKVTDAFPDWVVTKDPYGVTRVSPPINPNQVGRDLRPSISSPEVSKLIDEIDKPKFVDDLSTYLFGDKGFIDTFTRDNDLHQIVKMIEEGTPDEQIIKYVFDRKDLYNGAARSKWKFIASEVGYENWNEFYNKPMSELLDYKLQYEEAMINGTHKGMKKPNDAEIIRLQKANLKRDYFNKMFEGKTSLDDVEKIINSVRDPQVARNWDDFLDDMYNKGFSGQRLDDMRRNEWNIEAYMEKTLSDTPRQFEKKIHGVYTLDTETKNYVRDYYKKAYNFGDTLNVGQNKQIEELVEIVNEELVKKNKSFHEMMGKEQQSLMEYARKKHYAIKNSEESKQFAELFNDVKKIEVKKTAKEKLWNSVKRNSRVEFLEGGVKQGVVDSVDFIDGQKMLKVSYEGGTRELTFNSFLGRLSDSKPRTLDDIVNSSMLHKEFLDNRIQMTKKLERLKKTKSNLPDAYKANIDNIISKYNKSADEVHKESLKLNGRLEQIKSKLNPQDVERQIDELKFQSEKFNRLLSNADAFETYVRGLGVLDDAHVEEVLKKYNPNLGEYILRDDLDFSDAVRESIEVVRKDLIKMGYDEVAIGKLSAEQLDELMYEYVPRILTPEGERLFADKRNAEVFKKLENFGDDFGYGRKFNPYSKSRKITKIPTPDGTGWIENPTISQINEHFKQFTDGKNVFSENLADIYVQRALKHNDLMYDNKYMEDMLEMFGEDYTGEAKEGFSTVMNYGMLKKYSSDVVRMNTRLDISDMISRHLDDADVFSKIDDEVREVMATNYANLVTDSKDYILREKQIFNERISKYIDDFLKTELPSDARRELYLNNLKGFSEVTNTTGMLDDIAVPLGQLDDIQISSLNNQFDVLRNRYGDHIKNKFYKQLGLSQKYVDNIAPGKTIDEFVFGEVTDVDGQISKVKEWLKKDIDDAKASGEYVDFLFGNQERLLKKIDDIAEIQPPQIKQINDAIANKANQARKLQIIKDNNKFLDIYDKVTHFIKLNQTAILPSFHTRNKLSNIFNNWLEIGMDAYDLDFQKQTLKAMKGELVDDMFEIVGKDGVKTKIKWKDLYDTAIDYGAIDSGVFAKDVGVGKVGRGLLDGKVPGKFDPTNTKEFIGYTWGTGIGTAVENHDRFIHFASQVKNGYSFKDAAESVNKFLFDYSDLTMFEQGVMKRIFPYYTWIRKNAPLQLESMLNHPDKFRMISKVIGGLEGMVDEEDRIDKRFVNDFAKDWVQLPFYVTNPEGRREPVLWNPNLPFMDINRIPDITRPIDSMRDLFTQTNPIIKVPIEQMLNKNVFFDSPIVKKGQSQIGRRLDHVGKQFGAYPVIEGMANKSGLDFGLHLLNSTSGVKLLSYDYDAYKAMKINQLNKKKEQSRTNPGILDSIKRRLGGY